VKKEFRTQVLVSGLFYPRIGNEILNRESFIEKALIEKYSK